MIKVADVNKTRDLNLNKPQKTSGGGDFSAYLKEAFKENTSGVSAAGGISVADAIFAAQMVGGEEEREARRRQMKRASGLLERLEEIRDGLLAGHISKDRLIEISRQVKDQKFASNDPRLEELVSEIELRVEVELAKLMK